MKNIAIITSTRAEYGLLRPVFFELKKHKGIDTKLIVTGTHLSKKFGNTYKEINNDGINIFKKIHIIDENNFNVGKIFSIASKKFYDLFKKEKFHAIVILGDRYEMLAIASAAMMTNTPICHLYGGETTEGAIDECIRHSITKMSNIHFTSCKEYRKRVIQLGEDPKRVFNYGSTGVENTIKMELLSKDELSSALNFNLDKYFVITYHPVTLDKNNNNEFMALINAAFSFKDYQLVFTKANADNGGMRINRLLEKIQMYNKNVLVVDSLGTLKYLSLISESYGVLGNSSSGLIEAPALCVPCVNVGERQKGRIRPEGVYDCKPNKSSIICGIKKAIRDTNNLTIRKKPFYQKNTSKRIADKIAYYVLNDKFILMKKFYDINFKVK